MDETLADLQARYREFLETRGWREFHTPKSVAAAVSVEAAELLELFQWHDDLPADRVAEDPALVEDAREEVADVVIYCLSMADQLDFDLAEAVAEKMDENEARFDPERSEVVRSDLRRWRR